MTFFKPELVIRPRSRYTLDQHPQHGADVSYATELVYVPLEDTKLERLLQASEATGLTIEEIVQAAVSEVFSKRSAETSERLRPRSENNQTFYVFTIEIILS
jgi:hypothetical protein